MATCSTATLRLCSGRVSGHAATLLGQRSHVPIAAAGLQSRHRCSILGHVSVGFDCTAPVPALLQLCCIAGGQPVVQVGHKQMCYSSGIGHTECCTGHGLGLGPDHMSKMGRAVLLTAELLRGCFDLRQWNAACRPSHQAVAGQPHGPCLWLPQPSALQLADCIPDAGGQGCQCQVVSRLHKYNASGSCNALGQTHETISAL